MCDVTLKVDGCQFSAHRVILASSIPYFNTMFTTDMAEANMPIIVMQVSGQSRYYQLASIM